MTTLSEALAQAPNPLIASASPDVGGDGVWLDLDTVHLEARHELMVGLDRARRGYPQFLVLLGDSGIGKSHLLTWLSKQDHAAAQGLLVLVRMPPLPDLAQPFRHALRQLLAALCRKEVSAVPSDQAVAFERPIDRLVWEILYTQACDLLDASRVGSYQGPAVLLKMLGPLCLDAGKRRNLAEFAEDAQKVWPQLEPGLRSYLLSLPTENSIDTAARGVLLQYPYTDRRALCTGWLAGEDLSPKDRDKLSAKQVINNESAAKYVLCSLLRTLVALPGLQLGVLYDQAEQQLERLGLPGITAMAEVISTLHGSGASVLQVLAARPATWAKLNDRAPRSSLAQLKQVGKTVKLSKPEKELLRDLVEQRLKSSLPEALDKPSSVYPLKDADLALGSWPQAADTPQAALATFASLFEDRRRAALPPGTAIRGATAAEAKPRSTAQTLPRTSPPGSAATREADSDAMAKPLPPSATSGSAQWLTGEDDLLVPAGDEVPDSIGARPRSETHFGDSGAVDIGGPTPKAGPRLAPPRETPQSFVADSSPTNLVVAAQSRDVMGKVRGQPPKKAAETTKAAAPAPLSPSFVADSSPTVQALNNDVMGALRSSSAKKSTEAIKPMTQPAFQADSSPTVQALTAEVMEKLRASTAEPKPAAATAGAKKAEPVASKAAVVAAPVKLAETAKVQVGEDGGVPVFEADSSPTVKSVPDEKLLKASREHSRPLGATAPGKPAALSVREAAAAKSEAAVRVASAASAAVVAAKPEKKAESKPTDDSRRATPALRPPAELLQASRPSTAPGKPAASPASTANVAYKEAPEPQSARKVVATPAVAPPPEESVPEELPPSAQSPSMGWLAMASDNDPLAEAIKEAQAELGITPAATPSASASAKPAAKATPTTAAPAAPVAKAAMPATIAVPPPPEAIPTELPPSQDSPSMGWLAMASDPTELPESEPTPAFAAPKAAEPAAPKTTRAGRPMRGTMSLGVVVVNPATTRAANPEPASTVPAAPMARSTQARMPAIRLQTAQSLTAAQVLGALRDRGMMEEWELAQQLAADDTALSRLLATLEDEGRVRIAPSADGGRTVILLD